MFKEISDLLDARRLAALREIAARAPFIDGRISNPHNTAKQNTQLHDADAYRESSQILLDALNAHEDFRNFALPVTIAPPMMTRYAPGMRYGAHTDNAYLPLPAGTIRSDLSATIFLAEPESYEGGALRIVLGDRDIRFKGKAGSAVVYPSDMLHEVEEVTSGERLVAISFIQSRIADPFRRELLYELGEVRALEGNRMSHENFTRLSLVQQQLLRYWGDAP